MKKNNIFLLLLFCTSNLLMSATCSAELSSQELQNDPFWKPAAQHLNNYYLNFMRTHKPREYKGNSLLSWKRLLASSYNHKTQKLNINQAYYKLENSLLSLRMGHKKSFPREHLNRIFPVKLFREAEIILRPSISKPHDELSEEAIESWNRYKQRLQDRVSFLKPHD